VIVAAMRRRLVVGGRFEGAEKGNVLKSVMNGDGRIYPRVEGISIVDLRKRQMPYLTLFRVDRCEKQAPPHTAQSPEPQSRPDINHH